MPEYRVCFTRPDTAETSAEVDSLHTRLEVAAGASINASVLEWEATTGTIHFIVWLEATSSKLATKNVTQLISKLLPPTESSILHVRKAA